MPPHPSGSISDACGALGLNPSAAQLSTLNDYLALLHRWNATYNLTAVRDPQAMATQHLADCLTVMPSLLARYPNNQTLRVLDVGSGGGLPGVVLAIMQSTLDVTCVDAVGKKAAFIRQAAGQLRLTNLHAAHARVQDLRAPPFDLITSRAFASLADFTNWSTDQLAPGGVWMAMKGKLPADEMAALPPEIEVFHVEPLAVPGLDADRCLVWMRKRGTT
jgi:16S rRNA (guanine527-N7)-methyltransferase